jgi:D-alanyl-lipoteichoic acid acyltransferase DltB (MBOAT superfamily)
MGSEIGAPVVPKPRRALHRQYLPVPEKPEPRPDHAGLYAGEPEECRRNVRAFVRTLVHLLLLFAVFKVYRIEERAFQGRAFQTLVALALLALPVHYLTPYRFKKPLFVAISVIGLFWVFGSQVALVVLVVAALLIGTCFLPIPWIARVSILAALAVAIAWGRAEITQFLVPGNVWPIVASMFMFRLIVYLYELKHAKGRESLVDTLGYFFLLPNYCFMHFPVVDYRTMQRGYFAADVHTMQGRGLQMMFRGTVHLLCYRLVYHELLISPTRVHDLFSLAGYIVCNYLLYLQVSGQFHIACGMLHLFGFQLPETHHHYLLATSFTDYWRRINIYWKDFMIRVVFNPVVFRLKRWPQPIALAAATLAVFLTTWLLHAYQSYWLRATWGFTLPDALFWGILGALVLVNVQLDARRGPARARSRGAGAGAALTSAKLGARSIKVVGTFTAIALLWSLWSSPSLSEWFQLIHRGINGS